MTGAWAPVDGSVDGRVGVASDDIAVVTIGEGADLRLVTDIAR
ncbi:hypothetical protein J2X47_002416 [Sphingomonas sp. BE270]|nr:MULTISPECIES: hypothetical protein [unclassified Sphingomonas]MDR6848090.1 hypothetical protein [Sphingomonas sp. BE137]MDR7258230.1 hypothetical protein [Sphingomonas sp. BE270]